MALFDAGHFDYVVIDEFHHAAAPLYRRLLQHFRPHFLLGLTATPERSDQSDILSLCDDNLVYTRHLFDGIELGLLCPFHYFGIHDETVDYQEIPWRNGRFDPTSLSNKLATLGRARHALKHWRDKAQERTLAFCVSIAHADFMAERFVREGISAVAVYSGSQLDRSAALELLERGDLQVIFSVDLFNEGVDLPAIDTVMMLRPTESKVLFLQQLGRGLRLHGGKERLVVLDFIGNHQGFLNKPAETQCFKQWLAYWKSNPINAWTGGNRNAEALRWFEVRDGRFQPTFQVTDDEHDAFECMEQELIDYRLAAYEPRLATPELSIRAEPVEQSTVIIPFRKPAPATAKYTEIPYFADLRIACGHFRSGRTEADESCRVGPRFGRLDPARHLVARAIGNSMNGGKQPVQDGDYLLLELMDPAKAGSITGSTLVIERQGAGGEDQYLLRVIHKSPDGRYILKATNPDYPDYEADEGMRTLARLRAVLTAEDLAAEEGG